MNHSVNLLAAALRDPPSIARWSRADLTLLLQQARRANLLARLHTVLVGISVWPDLPEELRCHLESEFTYADAQARAIRWEVACIRDAVRETGVPVILLKGAAYVIADLPPAEGRIFSDVDILVPKEALGQVEQALFRRGWVTTHADPYDQRYYRQWMHELPPLRHVRRDTVLDVHHNILPETAAVHPDAAKIIAEAVAIGTDPGLKVLAPADMLLHSATHLFFDGELENGLRDLVDIDALLRLFSSRDPDFWDLVVARAAELDLSRPLFYALRYCSQILGTPVPASAIAAVRSGRPVAPVLSVMDGLFLRGLAPDHPSCDRPLTRAARWLLYARAHKLRMPLHLLIPHLVRKAIMRRFSPGPREAREEKA